MSQPRGRQHGSEQPSRQGKLCEYQVDSLDLGICLFQLTLSLTGYLQLLQKKNCELLYLSFHPLSLLPSPQCSKVLTGNTGSGLMSRRAV